jgi:putative intracellular protease/amidase
MKVLFVISSHREEPQSGKRTGCDVEEMAGLYYALQDQDAAVTLCSFAGGTPVPSPGTCDARDNRQNGSAVRRFINDIEAMYKLENTRPLQDQDSGHFDCVVFIGGPGARWEFPQNQAARDICLACIKGQKALAAIGSGNDALKMVTEKLADGAGPQISYKSGCALISAADARQIPQAAEAIVRHIRLPSHPLEEAI